MMRQPGQAARGRRGASADWLWQDGAAPRRPAATGDPSPARVRERHCRCRWTAGLPQCRNCAAMPPLLGPAEGRIETAAGRWLPEDCPARPVSASETWLGRGARDRCTARCAVPLARRSSKDKGCAGASRAPCNVREADAVWRPLLPAGGVSGAYSKLAVNCAHVQREPAAYEPPGIGIEIFRVVLELHAPVIADGKLEPGK